MTAVGWIPAGAWPRTSSSGAGMTKLLVLCSFAKVSRSQRRLPEGIQGGKLAQINFLNHCSVSARVLSGLPVIKIMSSPWANTYRLSNGTVDGIGSNSDWCLKYSSQSDLPARYLVTYGWAFAIHPSMSEKSQFDHNINFFPAKHHEKSLYHLIL